MSQSKRPPCYRLKRNHGTETPTSLLFLDCESNQEWVDPNYTKWDNVFRCCCLTYVRYDRGVVSRRDTLDSSDWMECWEWIESKQLLSRPLWVFGHNLGFDLTLLRFWEMIQLGRFRCGSTRPEESNGVLTGSRSYRGRLCIDGFPFFVYCLGRKGICKFVDTLNYFPYSLNKLGKAVGLPKQEFPGFEADDATTFAYCRNDVDITEKSMLSVLDCWRETDGGTFQPTAAMLSLASFRHKLPHKKASRPDATIYYDDRDDWTVLERSAYYGGQVTCFYIGAVLPLDLGDGDLRRAPRIETNPPPSGPLYLADVRSLYPAMMRDHKFPFRRDRRLRRVEPGELLAFMAAYGAIARVEIDSPVDEYTLRNEQGQRQVVGRFQTSLAGPELLRALRAGHVSRVIDAQLYCMDTLFRDWVDDWMRCRDKADLIGDKMRGEYAKLILTSLSGKFSQVGEHWVDRPGITPLYDFGHWPEVDADTKTTRYFRGICGHTQEKVVGAEPWYTFPAISAYVTAHGREWMRWVRSELPARSVLYQATDSLLLTQAGYYHLEGMGLVRDRELGYFELRHQGDYGEVLGCNHYRIGPLWVRSGAWGKAVEREPGKWFYQSFEGTKSILQTQPEGRVRVCEIELKKIGQYPKGKVGVDGWVSWPVLDETVPPF